MVTVIEGWGTRRGLPVVRNFCHNHRMRSRRMDGGRGTSRVRECLSRCSCMCSR